MDVSPVYLKKMIVLWPRCRSAGLSFEQCVVKIVGSEHALSGYWSGRSR